ncbi:hexose kinase [Nocardia cyriacigeorgica]|uniref:hexose kinase n=1 Tax=Nocardia cyriacigeorgica TaxID=135487 RepID=UPI000CE9D828|nr:hexose kinase [Nocardia cyriacigeorgica]MBF6085600.1 hexose kinase [Nocardia cyriacigeorgica]MBF6091689.1 hexose kinase [Nocardia cyriacigeorgica]MBF6394675.1 hexose kinase [Nocardia cyriacigeorgica]MBF6400309.1 hexose kinase [Nocardia cyriacigeorgica]MBF6494896.1 hexose kinase [Nocardia cyriacigeorgica]
MILTVTMNPAYDMTYRVEELERGRAHRVRSVEQRIGGKGINVTRVLNQLGKYARATGFADHAFAAAAELELPVDFVHALPWVRRTVVISESDSGTATALWEPGARITNPHAAEQLAVRVAGLLPDISGLVIAGSLPGGIDPELPAQIARSALDHGVPTICDLDGAAMRLAARLPGVVLTPNRGELRRLTDSDPQTPAEVVESVRPLIADGVLAVLAKRGAEGMVAVTAEGAWTAALPEPLAGNPTGAGDSATAAVIAALSTRAVPDWPAILTDAVATSAAAVVIPVAGEIDRRLRSHLAPTVRVEQISAEGGREIAEAVQPQA